MNTLKEKDQLQKEAQYARIVYRMCGIGLTAKTADLLLRISRCFDKMKGKMSLNEFSEIEAEWEADWKTQDDPDDVSAETLPK